MSMKIILNRANKRFLNFFLFCFIYLWFIIIFLTEIIMGKTQYSQKFRDDWLNEKCFKDWLLKLETDFSKGKCRFCKCEVNAKRFDLLQHVKTKKHTVSSKDFSTSRLISKYARTSSTKTSNAEGTLCLYIAAHCSILSADHLGVLCKTIFNDSEAGRDIKMDRTKCTYIITIITISYIH